MSERAKTVATHPLTKERSGIPPLDPVHRPAAAASRRKLPGAAARHPAKTPKAHFRTPAYLPDRPDRLAPCRGPASDVTLRRPYARYANLTSLPSSRAKAAIGEVRAGGCMGRSHAWEPLDRVHEIQYRS